MSKAAEPALLDDAVEPPDLGVYGFERIQIEARNPGGLQVSGVGTMSERKQKVCPRLSAVMIIMSRLWPGARRMVHTWHDFVAVFDQRHAARRKQGIVVGVDVADAVAKVPLVRVLPFAALAK